MSPSQLISPLNFWPIRPINKTKQPIMSPKTLNYGNKYTYYSIFVTVMSHECVTKMNLTSTAAKAWFAVRFAALFLFRLI